MDPRKLLFNSDQTESRQEDRGGAERTVDVPSGETELLHVVEAAGALDTSVSESAFWAFRRSNSPLLHNAHLEYLRNSSRWFCSTRKRTVRS